MFDITSILDPDCVRAQLPLVSKKKVLEYACEVLAARHVGVEPVDLFDNLLERERLGSTAIGHGVGLPHCRLDTSRTIVAALLQLSEPIDFDAPEHDPVDLVLVLVVPVGAEDEHLKLIAHLAEALDNPQYRQALRAARTDSQLYEAARALPPPREDVSRSA